MFIIRSNSAGAAIKDYLIFSISRNVLSQQFSIQAITQKALEESGVTSSSTGNYELFLTNSESATISSGKFSISSFDNFEAISNGTSGYGQYSKPQIYSFSVVVPVISSFNSADILVTIKNGGQVVYSKNLSEIPINIVSAQQAIIKYETPQPIKASETDKEGEKVESNLYIIIGGITILALLIVVIFVFIKRKKLSVDTSNSSTPSLPPLP